MITILGLFLNNQIRTGGHRRYLELLEDLAARGNSVIVFLNSSLDYTPTHFREIRVDAPYSRRGFPPASYVFSSAVRAEVNNHPNNLGKVDWILIHGETHLSAAMYLKRRLGAKLFFGSRSNVVRASAISMQENRKKPFAWLEALGDNLIYRRYERKCAVVADLICFQSTYDRDDFLARQIRLSPTTVIIGGNIGGPRFKTIYDRANQSKQLKKLLFVGTLGERKGLRYLLEALSILNSRGVRDIELDVLGEGADLKTHLEYTRVQGFTDRVRFHGRQSDPFPFYASADLLVVPSLFDSYPDTVLEALHVGLPVIAAKTGGIPDQLCFDELLFPIRDAKSIADRIEEAYRDNDIYREFRRLCGLRRDSFVFDWTATWQKWMQEFNTPEVHALGQ